MAKSFRTKFVSDIGVVSASSDTTVTGNLIANGKTIDAVELGYLDGLTSAIQTQLDAKAEQATTYTKTETDTALALKAPLASPTFTGTVSGISKSMVGLGNVDNTADTAKPVSTAQQSALDLKANLASPTFTGTVSGITKSMVGLGSVDNTSDVNKPVSAAQQTALDLKANQASTYTKTETDSRIQAVVGAAPAALDTLVEIANQLANDESAVSALTSTVATKAPLASPSFTGTVSGISKSMVGLGNVDNTADTAKPVSTAQQTALDLKANLASPTFTGTVSGISKSMVGLGNVDNTADTAKPVSTAQQTALDLKANLASPTFTGTPAAPTATAGTNTNQIASTSFVTSGLAGKEGTITAGTTAQYYRGDKSWQPLNSGAVGLGSVENTALSTWAGSANVTTVGTIGTGTWNATAIADGKIASALTGKTYNGITPTAAATGFTVAGGTTSKTLTVSNTVTLAGTDGSTLNIGTGGTLGSGAYATIANYAPLASPTFTGTVSGITATMVGLGNVNNTADTAKPVSTAQQTALDLKANLAAPTITGLKEVKVALAANNVDLATGNIFSKTISGATTLTVSNVPATGTVATFILDLTNGGSAAITWWSGMKWASGTAPTLTSAGRDILGFFTHDGGTTWNGTVIAKDVK